MRQLFHLGVIEAFTGTLKKERSEEMPPYPVAISPELNTQLDQLLDKLGLKPPPKPVSRRLYHHLMCSNEYIVVFVRCFMIVICSLAHGVSFY